MLENILGGGNPNLGIKYQIVLIKLKECPIHLQCLSVSSCPLSYIYLVYMTDTSYNHYVKRERE